MSRSVQRCLDVSRSVQRYSELFKGVWRYPGMSRDIQRCLQVSSLQVSRCVWKCSSAQRCSKVSIGVHMCLEMFRCSEVFKGV